MLRLHPILTILVLTALLVSACQPIVAPTSSAPAMTGYTEVNGARLYYETAGSGEAVVMIHGWGGDRRDWDDLFPALAQQYQVIRYDLRGYGRSTPHPPTEPYSHVGDLKALLTYLGVTQAHVIGQSYGGGIALDFAIMHPEMTRSLLLSSPDVGGTENLAYTAEEQVAVDKANAAMEAALTAQDWQAAAEALLELPEFAVAAQHPTAGARLVELVKDFDWWPIFQADPVMTLEPPAVDQLAKVTAPTLVIVGERSSSVDLARADLLEQGIAGAQKVVIPGVDHLGHLEEPVKFAEIVLQFLVQQAEMKP